MIGAGCLILACLTGALLSQLAGLDETVFRWVQGWRTCSMADSAAWLDVGVRGALLGLAVGVGARGGGRWRSFALLALVVVAGAVLGELLKTALERTRPNESPGDFSGNSFPSGHVMNTTLVVVALVDLARRTGCRAVATALVAVLGGASVLAQTVYRIVNGSHWLTDVVASALLGVGWVLVAGDPARRTTDRKTAAGVAVVAVILYAIFYFLPELRPRLPSVLERSLPALGRVELGAPEPGLGGRWSHGWREPVGGVSWVVSRRAVIRLASASSSGQARRLRLTMRPPGDPEGAQGCVRVRVTINGSVEEIALLEGWREYLFAAPIPGEAVLVGIEVLDDLRGPGVRAPGRLAVHDLRLD